MAEHHRRRQCNGAGTAGRGARPPAAAHARTTRRSSSCRSPSAAVTALLVVAQAWLLATRGQRGLLPPRVVAALRDPLLALLAVIVGRAPSWPGPPSGPPTGPRPRPSRSCGTRWPSTSPPSGPAGSSGTDRDAHRAGHDRDRRPRRLLLPLPAPALPGGHRPGDHHRRRGRSRLDLGGDHRGDRSADPGVHGASSASTTRDRTARQLRRSSAWPGTSSTSWPGLPTLKVFGRAKAQAAAIADVTDRYRRTTHGHAQG